MTIQEQISMWVTPKVLASIGLMKLGEAYWLCCGYHLLIQLPLPIVVRLLRYLMSPAPCSDTFATAATFFDSFHP